MLRFSRRFGQPAATLAGMEAAAGDAVGGHRLRPAGPARADRRMVARWREGYEVVYAQRRTREGETLPKRIVAARRLPRHQAHRRRRDPAEHRRLPADEPARRRQRRRARRGARLPARARRARRLPRRPPCSTTATRARPATSKYNRFFGSLVIGLNGIVGFSRYPLHLISLLGVILLSAFAVLLGGRLLRAEARRRPVPDRQPDDRAS